MSHAMMHPMWEMVLGELKRSIYAEQVFCSVTTEMSELPEFQNHPAMATLHKENYETIYRIMKY